MSDSPDTLIINQQNMLVKEFQAEIAATAAPKTYIIKIKTKEDNDDHWDSVFLAKFTEIISVYSAHNKDKNSSIIHLFFKYDNITLQYNYKFLTAKNSQKFLHFISKYAPDLFPNKK